MNTKIKVLIRSEVRDAVTGKTLRFRKARENMVFDSGLTALATGTSFANFCRVCKIGSSNAPNSIPGNTTTFTQAGNTITASAAFFTAPMVGGIFKYGVGSAGAEQYIATVAGGGLSCTVTGPGMIVGVATVGTVWQVQQTALTTPLIALLGGCVSINYLTSPGACSTTFPGGANSTQVQLTRTYEYAVQAAPYTVNEIGYGNNGFNSGDCFGRIVLPGGDTIAPTEYYVVNITVTFTVAPNVPTVIPNVGTGIDTSGTLMFQAWGFTGVDANGNPFDYQSSQDGIMDAASFEMGFMAVAPSLPPHIVQGVCPGAAPLYLSTGATAFSNTGLAPGVARSTISFNLNSAGETINALAFGSGGVSPYPNMLVLNLTNPLVLPNGPYIGNLVIERDITRTLTN